MAINVGAECIDRNSHSNPLHSYINKSNSSNATGTIDSICVCANTDMTGIKFASFIDEGSDVFSTRGDTNGSNFSCTIAESPKTFNAPGDFTAFDINTGDYIGCYFTGGLVEKSTSGVGIWYKLNTDAIPCSSASFTFLSSMCCSFGATGTETAPPDFIPQIIMF